MWIRGVATRGGGCMTGQENPPVTRTMPIVLPLTPGAPPARSLRLLLEHLPQDRAPYSSAGAFTPYLDADVGVSRAITWKLWGDTGSVRFDPAKGSLQYRCLVRSGYLTSQRCRWRTRHSSRRRLSRCKGIRLRSAIPHAAEPGRAASGSLQASLPNETLLLAAQCSVRQAVAVLAHVARPAALCLMSCRCTQGVRRTRLPNGG
jgi:hypothetical protein